MAQKFKNTFINNPEIKEEIQTDIRKYLEQNDNMGITYKNSQEIANAEQRGKFIILKTYILEKWKH